MDNIYINDLMIPGDLPDGCILGVNYSGMHDSAIAIISPVGDVLYAISLERLTRTKQDGQPLDKIFDQLPWQKIARAAVSAPKTLGSYVAVESRLLSCRLGYERDPRTLAHQPAFLDILAKIPCQIEFVGHQRSHAATAFYGSGFDEAICLTLDGGMSNDFYFGGVFECRNQEIKSLDKFDAVKYAKIATIYTFVTALLEHRPMRHEGKITGLAAYGNITEKILEQLDKWMSVDYFDVERALYWLNCYSRTDTPQLVPNITRLKRFQDEIKEVGFEKADIAASLQYYSEQHVLDILRRARDIGWHSGNICLAGGLFANVKINQKISEAGYDHIFIAPPMTDDGTSLGAAWVAASRHNEFTPKKFTTMALGPAYKIDEVLDLIKDYSIEIKVLEYPAMEIAKILSNEEIISVYRGRMEFGPRALGYRSVLASANRHDVNEIINKKLRRTEFMPFAPMIRAEDAPLCMENIEKTFHTSQFMTITLDCTELLRETCPAIVHVDGTARPQVVVRESDVFMHDVLTEYEKMTGRKAILNTSFNIHEEPIVRTPLDALRGFFEAGLDHLYIEGVGLISYKDNRDVALKFIREHLSKVSKKEVEQRQHIIYLDENLEQRTEWLEKASKDLIERTEDLVSVRKVLVERTVMLEECVRNQKK